MAQYNADIRIGVTGKTQLNQLEKQLERTQTKLKKLNKELNLRAKVQTIKVNTKGATTAIRALEDRINKLGRTVTINVRQNEKPGKGGSSGGSNVTAVVGSSAQSLVAAKALRPISKALTDEAQKQLDLEEARATAVEKLVDNKQKEAAAQERLSKAIRQQEKLSASKNNVTAANYFGAGTSRESGLKLIGKEIRNAETSLRNLQGVQTRFKGDVVATTKAYQGLTGEIKRSEQAASQAATKAAARADRNKRFRKGAGAGAAVAGLRIPGLEGASAGALGGFAVGGRSGAIGGGLVGLSVDLVKNFAAATSEVTKFNNELKLSQKALANTVSSSEELEFSLNAIDKLSKDFNVPIGDATTQFTKLNAAARASGFGVEEVTEVYRSLAAANVALGGDATRLNGILLATQQVFSKGKVQAEELRGQIGERLAGAFAKFAESAGLSTSELDKALEKGEVSLEDFVRFSKSLLDEYEENAKRLSKEPENAAARLKLAMDDLKKAAGPILQSIGNAFTELATAAVQSLTKMLNAINDFRMAAAKGKYQETRRNLQEQRDQLATDVANKNKDTFIPTIGSNQIIAAQTRAVQAAKAANDRAFGDLNRLRKQMLPAIEASGNELPTKLTQNTPTPDGKGSKGGAGRGPTDRSDELLLEIKYQTRLNELQKQQVVGNERAVQANQTFMDIAKLRIEYETELERIDQQDLTTASKTYAKELARLQLLEDVGAIELENAQIAFDRKQDLEATLRGLQEQIDIEGALTDETKLQAEWAARIAELQANGSYDPAEKVAIEAKLNQLYSQRLALLDPLVQYQRELERNLGDTRGQIASLARTIETELGTALSNAITGLIDGTTTVQEAFSDMFANIGKAFIDMATQMIAKALIMKALGILTGGNSGMQVGSGGMPTSGMGGMFNLSGGQFGAFAEGGFVTSPTNAQIGEAGESEYVIPASKMKQAMGRYANGSRGESVIPGKGGSGGAGGGADGSTIVNYNGPTLKFNSEDYVPASAVPEIINAAAKRGAKEGEQRTFSALMNSRGQRSRIGL